MSTGDSSSERQTASSDVWQWKDMHGWKALPHWMVRVQADPGMTKAKERDSGVSELALLGGEHRKGGSDAGSKTDDEIRFLLYGEVMQAWRQLTDVRFRVLNMLPALSVVAIVPLLLMAQDAGWFLLLAGVGLAALGLRVTHGLHVYEQRNDGLHDDLISRARLIEAELGIQSGVMMNRPKGPTTAISHGRGTRLVFTSIKYAWGLVGLVLVVNLIAELD